MLKVLHTSKEPEIEFKSVDEIICIIEMPIKTLFSDCLLKENEQLNLEVILTYFKRVYSPKYNYLKK